MKKYQFEVCANSVESCLAAQAGGADRVELCAGIPEGGTTPSYGEISTARDMLTTTRLHVIIRPRGGDFLYSPIEVRTMLKDIEMARQLGADGVVFGCLTANGEIDLPVMQELMKASQGLSVTFHRAFDICRDPEKALEQIIERGITSLSYDPKKSHKKIPVTEWFSMMGRTKHLATEEYKSVADQIQAEVDRRYERLLARAGHPLL